jgi:hypothetical protein
MADANKYQHFLREITNPAPGKRFGIATQRAFGCIGQKTRRTGRRLRDGALQAAAI